MSGKKKGFVLHNNSDREVRKAAMAAELLKTLEAGPKTFVAIFDGACPALRAASPKIGEEIIRLRSYEVLQGLYMKGKVDKVDKHYALPKTKRHEN